MGYYIQVEDDTELKAGKKIELPLGKKNAIAVAKAFEDAGIPVELYFSSEPKKIEEKE